MWSRKWFSICLRHKFFTSSFIDTRAFITHKSCQVFSSKQPLAVAGDSKLISLYTVSTGEHITNLSGHTSWIFSLAWNETGEFLLSSSYEGKAKVWSLETMKCVSTIAENDGPLLCCAWLDKEWGRGVLAGINRGVVTVGEDRAIRWYRDASGQ